METNEILIVTAVVIASVVAGALLSYFIVGVLMKATTPIPVIVDSPPVCPGELYTPGTCGMDSGMTFTQCIVNTTESNTT